MKIKIIHTFPQLPKLPKIPKSKLILGSMLTVSEILPFVNKPEFNGILHSIYKLN